MSRSELELENDRLRGELDAAREEVRQLRRLLPRPTVVAEGTIRVEEGSPSSPPPAQRAIRPLYSWDGPWTGDAGDPCPGAKCGGLGRSYGGRICITCEGRDGGGEG